MLRFMVLSAPRSASTWVANWLTTEKTLCLHDPVLEHTPEALDGLPCDRVLGIACTALALLPDFVNTHPARKVVVHRDIAEVNQSLVSIGLTPLAEAWSGCLEGISGLHVEYGDLFIPGRAARIYTHLTKLPFDAARHEQLCVMHVEPQFDQIAVVPGRAKDFRRRVMEALA